MGCILCDEDVRRKKRDANLISEISSLLKYFKEQASAVKNAEQFSKDFATNGAFQHLTTLFLNLDTGLPGTPNRIDYLRVLDKLNVNLNSEGRNSTQHRFFRALFRELAITASRQGVEIPLCDCVIMSNKREQQRVFKEECDQILTPIIKKKIQEGKGVHAIAFESKIYFSNKEILIAVKYHNDRETRKKFTGKRALKEAASFIRNFLPASFDISTLNTQKKIDSFIRDKVRPALARFNDYTEIVSIDVITSDRIVPIDRYLVRGAFKQKDVYLIEIQLAAGEIIRQSLKNILRSRHSYLRQMQPWFKQMNDVMTLDAMVHAKDIRAIYINKFGSNHARCEATIIYSDSSEQSIRYLANYPKSLKPALRLSHSTVKTGLSERTHEIFYLWSADERSISGRRIVFKFGITSVRIDDKYDTQDIKESILRRIRDYAKQHQLDIKNEVIELISEPQAIESGSRTVASLFESTLKDKKLNRLLFSKRGNETDYRSNPTELMFADTLIGHNVKTYVVELALEHAKSLKFLDI